MGAIIWQKVTISNTTGAGVQMGSYPYSRNANAEKRIFTLTPNVA